MAMVYVVTAGRADTYRIERVYLDPDEAHRFAHDYNGTAPNEPVQVEEWESGAPPGVYDGPYWRAEWWARVPVSKRRGELRRTRDGERFDDFDIRQGGDFVEVEVVRDNPAEERSRQLDELEIDLTHFGKVDVGNHHVEP